jgi:hypothetical protein
VAVEQRIDDLIKAGWGVLESDLDPTAFQLWRRSAFDCLAAMFGPDHVYTRHFENFVQQGGETDLLAANGILSAAKEQASYNGQGAVKTNGNVTSVPLTKKTGGSINREPYK